MKAAQAIVADLGLEPHPEGGWFRRTWTAATRHNGDRAAGSAIQYLLDATGPSRWHRIDATELWLHLDGAALELSRWSPEEGLRTELIGRPAGFQKVSFHGVAFQMVVQPHEWQRARSTGAWSLVTCVVVPEFRYDGFELAPRGWEPPR